ncbi:MAG: hypothetical protein K6L76_09195 [Agarilytica sp.]
MFSNIQKLFYVFSLAALLAACGSEDSADVNQDRIHTVYEVFYNQNDDVTHVIARFRFGGPLGTLLRLGTESGASVSYDGDTLPYSDLWGAHHREYVGDITGGTFIYTNTDGDVFTNLVPSGSSIGFPDAFAELSRSAAFELIWEGTPLAPNDQVGVFVGSWVWGDDALFWEDGDGAASVVMGVNQLSNLPLGTAVVYMDRWNERNVAQGTSEGGKIRYKYRGSNAVITVVD